MILNKDKYEVLLHDGTGRNPDYYMSISGFKKLLGAETPPISANQIFGGDIYIQKEPPSSPQDGDIWFDLTLVRR